MPLTQKEIHIENFKKAIVIAKQKKEKSFFVFDVDSTLFCMKYRTEALIKNALKEADFFKKFPEHLDKIKQIKVTEKDWSIKDIMSRYGFSETEAPVLAMEKIWRKGFFANDYLYLDKPYKSSVSFLKFISQLGVKIYYLTARSRKTMYEGTIESLKKWEFPLESEKHLIMKENSEIKDEDYKAENLKNLAKASDTILFFENEPVVLNKVNESIPQIHLFWIDSTHSHRAEPPKKALPLSMNYELEQYIK